MLYLCIIDAKQTRASKICGLAQAIFFVGLPELFREPLTQNHDQGSDLKEEERIQQTL
jgi:hypothetical protein